MLVVCVNSGGHGRKVELTFQTITSKSIFDLFRVTIWTYGSELRNGVMVIWTFGFNYFGPTRMRHTTKTIGNGGP